MKYSGDDLCQPVQQDRATIAMSAPDFMKLEKMLNVCWLSHTAHRQQGRCPRPVNSIDKILEIIGR